MSNLHRNAAKRGVRSLALRVGGARTIQSNTGSGVSTGEAAATSLEAEATVSALPKFIMGHPELGGVPPTPLVDPVWEI